MPRDVVADFFASQPRRSATVPSPRERTVAEELEGTIFADPVKDFFVREGLHRKKPRSVQIVDNVVDKLFTAPKALTNWARENAESLSTPELDDSWLTARAKGFGAGAHEAAAGLMSPFNIATAAAPIGRVPGALGALLRATEGAGNAFQVGMSAHQTKDALEAGDTKGAALGVGMTALGALGAAASLRGGPMPGYEPAPREVFENGNHRRPPLGPEHFPADDVFEPNPNLGGDRSRVNWNWGPRPRPEPEVTVGPVPPRPSVRVDPILDPGLYPPGLPASDPVAELFAAAEQGRLPARAGGPLTPPAPPKSIAAVPPPIPEASRWQQPAGAPEPSSAPPAVDPLDALLSQPPARRTPPAKPQPAGTAAEAIPGIDLAAERARLEKQGLNPRVIDLALEKLVMGDAAPTPVAGAPIPPPADFPTVPLEERMAADRARREARGRVEPAPLPPPVAPLDSTPVQPTPPPAPPVAADLPAPVMEAGSAPVEPTALEPQRPAAPVPAPGTDPVWDRVLAAAREQGFDGPDDELLSIFNDRRRSARELIDDLRQGAEEFSPTSMMKFIRQHGGLRPKDNGDLAVIVEGFASPSTRNQRGGASIFRKDGQTIDDMLVAINADGRWGQFDEHTLSEYLDGVARSATDEGFDIPSLESALRAAGVDEARPWWKDGGDDSFDPAALEGGDLAALSDADVIERWHNAYAKDRATQGADPQVQAELEALDVELTRRGNPDAALNPPITGDGPGDPLADILSTGEVQPRLPGDVGAVREQSAPTPEFEAPFSLTREVGPGDTARTATLPLSDRGTPDEISQLLGLSNPRTEPASGVPASGAHSTLTGSSPENALPATAADTPPAVADADRRSGTAGSSGSTTAADGGGTSGTAASPEPTSVKANVKDFLVRQLRYSPEEVDAMGPAAALELGNKVRFHPEGVRAGIAAHAKPAPEPYRSSEPSANLGEDSLRVETDELAKILNIQPRRQALARTRVPAEDVNVPRSTIEPEGLSPRTPAERHAAGEKLTTAERKQLGLPEDVPERDTPKSQSEIALAKSAMTENARRMKRLIDNPTPENLDEYVRLLGEQAERQATREFKKGREGDLQKNERTGEYLASGLGGLEKLYHENPARFWMLMRASGGGLIGALSNEEDPLSGALAGAAAGAALSPKLFKAIAAKAPSVAQALKDTLPPSIGGKPGKPVGTAGVRAPRDLKQDIGGLEMLIYGQPHRTVPDVWKEISPVLEEMAASERALPSTTPRMFQFTRNMYVNEMLATVNRAARDAKEGGLPRRAKYLEAMADELKGVPTVAEKIVERVTSGHISAKDARKQMHRLENAVYLNLLGAAIDTALVNRTQVLLAYPHVGGKNLLAGMKRARTEAGQTETQHLNLDTPSDSPEAGVIQRVPNSTVRKVVDAVMSPLKASDVRNRKDAYLSAIIATRAQGLNPKQAHEFAMEVTAQTQGTPGELGANPFHRQLGPLRMFTKYPSIWGQWLIDIATHPDPGVRRRGVGYFLGFGAAGAVTRISVGNMLFPRLMVSGVAAAAALDLAKHIPGLNAIVGKPDHTLSEDLDPRRGARSVARYPVKAGRELLHFGEYGFGPHADTKADGTPRGEHSAWEGFLSLLGLKSSRQAAEQKSLDEAYDWIAEKSRRRGIESRQAKQDLQRAIEASDNDAASVARKNLSPAQLRSFYKRRQQDRFQQLRERVPPADRPEFDRRFKAPLTGDR